MILGRAEHSCLLFSTWSLGQQDAADQQTSVTSGVCLHSMYRGTDPFKDLKRK